MCANDSVFDVNFLATILFDGAARLLDTYMGLIMVIIASIGVSI